MRNIDINNFALTYKDELGRAGKRACVVLLQTNEWMGKPASGKFEYHQGPLRAALGSGEHAFHSRFHYCKADHQ